MDKRLSEPRTPEQWAAYARGEGEDWEYGTPDEESPELTDEELRWAVRSADFGGDFMAVERFLTDRAEFLRDAEAAGMPREAFLPFRPNEPGFMERAREAFTALPKAMGWAAE
jgi:hypothetical protein